MKTNKKQILLHTKELGFTLMELMVVIMVIAITMAVAIPSFQTMISDNRITSETNRLISDIQLARSEAMKRGVRVVLCRSGDTTVANPVCGGSANTWTKGWLVFASGDNNSTYESANDTLLRVSHAAAIAVTVKSNGTSDNNLVFFPNASTDEAGGTAKFVICDQRGASYGKEVQVPPVGRPRLASSVSSCTSPS